MKPPSLWPVFCVLGPTASGKTSLAIAAAQMFGTEIVSADSRQVFRRMEIGTNKPTPAEQAAAKHHLIDAAEPDMAYNVADYVTEAVEALSRLGALFHSAVVAGGTGFYAEAIEKGVSPAPKVDVAVRQQVMDDLETNGLGFLLAEIAKHDPVCYSKIDRANPRRVARALEVIRATGKPFSAHADARKIAERPFRMIKVALDLPRAELYSRIDARVEEMMSAGLLAETAGLLESGVSARAQSMQAIGYRELVQHLEGQLTLNEAIAAIQQNTRNYARRQITWFRRDSSIRWMRAAEPDAILAFFKAAVDSGVC